MPSFQGVEVAIVTEPGSKKLPEFPLSNSHQTQEFRPRISVYIPSEPGTHFGIHYALNKVVKPPPYFYFKIFINGRSVANCGADSLTQASGSIVRSLCVPSDRWKYKEDGVLYIREGIEARCFGFLPTGHKSIAEEGGFIEVQIFRAKGRIRRLPVLEKHRGQETYGIGSPSGGLLDSPDEARYYDWILIDPKESPFVTFRFHYRTWSNLYQLSLAPRPDKLDISSTHAEKGSAGSTKTGGPSGTPSYYKTTSASLPKLSSEETNRFKSDQGISSSSSDSSIRLRGIIKTAPVILPPSHPTRPLPEIPIKKPIAYKDAGRPVLAYTCSSLSDISEETEDTETSITAILPAPSDSPRSNEHGISECRQTKNSPVPSLLEDLTNPNGQEPPIEKSEDDDVTETKEPSAKPEIERTGPSSDTASKVAKAEL
ncbi:hypothetical protein FPOAC2_02108 [Fusarium poae]|uniref:Uncharacterized protein n=1 Tax=Fusarium poae TaxID=36050 RepID=A0A1B8B5K0_FUSPO|nr:hypothetical protein FPOAC1_002022 [Fusarium poae]KAG8676026.1 hypothetical protein FPOAC1_002022 [Fusarium poae]OBS27992.1 hypothetical protein FPOA_01932 [Fusarium poae]